MTNPRTNLAEETWAIAKTRQTHRHSCLPVEPNTSWRRRPRPANFRTSSRRPSKRRREPQRFCRRNESADRVWCPTGERCSEESI